MPVRFNEDRSSEAVASDAAHIIPMKATLDPATSFNPDAASSVNNPDSECASVALQSAGGGSSTIDDELDNRSDARSLTSGSENSSGGFSGASSLRSLTGRGKKGGCPFYVYAMLAMAVPIVALLAYAGITLYPIISDMSLINQEKDTLITARRCAGLAANERDVLGMFVVSDGIFRQRQQRVLLEARAAFDACRAELRPQLRATAERRGGQFALAADRVANDLEGLKYARARVDVLAALWTASGPTDIEAHEPLAREMMEHRAYFSRLSAGLMRPISATARILQGHSAGEFTELLTAATLRSYIGLANGVGAEIITVAEAALRALNAREDREAAGLPARNVSAPSNSTANGTNSSTFDDEAAEDARATDAEQQEYLEAYGRAVGLLDVAVLSSSKRSEAALRRWAAADGAGGPALAQMKLLAGNSSGYGVLVAFREAPVRRRRSGEPEVTVSASRVTELWESRANTADAALGEIDRENLARITSASGALAESVYLEVGKTMAGMAMCLVAGGILARQQQRISKSMESQLAHVSSMQKAVTAFVPRAFLASMGYTSITQVASGTCTQVATSLLFADIQAFTTIAEAMDNDQLFEWVQRYFACVTRVVEQTRGDVNLFIGDALFAVFKAPRDALLCAVDMQTEVDKQNLDQLKEDPNATPVTIGIGVHHAVVAMGILGDERRHTCTMISSAVNLASRLEGLTRHLHCRVLASDALVSLLADRERAELRLRRLGPAMVKGSATPVVIHEVFQCDARAMQLYKAATVAAFERFTAKLLPEGAPQAGDGTVDCGAKRGSVVDDVVDDTQLQKALQQSVEDVADAKKLIATIRLPVPEPGSAKPPSDDSELVSNAATPHSMVPDAAAWTSRDDAPAAAIAAPMSDAGSFAHTANQSWPTQPRCMSGQGSDENGPATPYTGGLRRFQSTVSPGPAAVARRRVGDHARRLLSRRGDPELLDLFDTLVVAQGQANVYDATVPAIIALGSRTGVLRPGGK